MQVERDGTLWYVPGGTEDWVSEEVRSQWNCPTMQDISQFAGNALGECSLGAHVGIVLLSATMPLWFVQIAHF